MRVVGLSKWRTIIFLIFGIGLFFIAICPATLFLTYQNYIASKEALEIGAARVLRPDNWLILSERGRIPNMVRLILGSKELFEKYQVQADKASYEFAVIRKSKIIGQVVVAEITSDQQKRIQTQIDSLISEKSEGVLNGSTKWVVTKFKTWDALLATRNGITAVFVPGLRLVLTTEDVSVLRELSMAQMSSSD